PPPAASSSSIAAPVQQQAPVKEVCVQDQVGAPAASCSSELPAQQAQVQQGTIAQPTKKGFFHRLHK
ncbi:MAG TPA: hypothetical protein VFH51_02075, partial [Myxococcota bacterium]|nr:hypothetical protein [Myxococcota bacterium]